MNITTSDCLNPRTIKLWNSPLSWVNGVVPSKDTEVVIPSSAGVIQLTGDVIVHSLQVFGGTIIGHINNCPIGWSPLLIGTINQKCLKLYDTAVTEGAAADLCVDSLSYINSTRQTAHIVQIESSDEQSAVRRLCRGDSQSNASTVGCWVGLKDPLGNNDWDWVQPTVVKDSTFRDWRRFDLDNKTVDQGQYTNGELCTSLIPWWHDPLILEQGSWDDVSCESHRAVVCEYVGATVTRFQLTVLQGTDLNGNTLWGGVYNLRGTLTTNNVFIHQAVVQSNGASTIQSDLFLGDGASLSTSSQSTIYGSSYLGEPTPELLIGVFADSLGIQPTLLFGGNVITATSAGYPSGTVVLNATVVVKGTLNIHSNTVINMMQGGDLSQATLVTGSHAGLLIQEAAVKASAFDSFELKLTHRGPVIGEYFMDKTAEFANRSISTGVYRLQVTDVSGNTQVTHCISYNATADELAYKLNSLNIISSRGGVTVRRYGDGGSHYRFGYKHRIELDAIKSSLIDQGRVSIDVNCISTGASTYVGCGCGVTKVPLIDKAGTPNCPRVGNSSNIDPTACAFPPTITVTRVTSLNYLRTSSGNGGGIAITNGTHRLPFIINTKISIQGNTVAVIAADTSSIANLWISAYGTLVVGGVGWPGYDSAFLLYEPVWTTRRGLASLNSAPAFALTISTYNLSDYSNLLCAGTGATVSLGTGSWSGGSIGGRATLSVSGVLTSTGSMRVLRYAATLVILSGSQLTWLSGDIGLSDGAQVVLAGSLIIGTVSNYFGNTSLIRMHRRSYSADEITYLLPVSSGRNWHGYFDLTLPRELRTGWYLEPLCGSACLIISEITVLTTGTVTVNSESKTFFIAPVKLMGAAQLIINSQSSATIESGGICDVQAVVTVNLQATFVLDGGYFNMTNHCRIRGNGELLVTGGQHDMASTIEAHITISGGTMVWPKVRGDGSTLVMTGGLVMQSTGSMLVEPWSTVILIHGQTTLLDECEINFPTIGTAAEPGPYDKIYAPDDTPRGNFTIAGRMYWNGGTLHGKANFFCRELYLGQGTKRIRSLAKLLNLGHAEWSEGDVIMGDLGDFVNLGSVQMSNGDAAFDANNVVEGSILPLENGGDVFALNFHSWDLDQGALDYSEYIKLRKEFVSRTPTAWTTAHP